MNSYGFFYNNKRMLPEYSFEHIGEARRRQMQIIDKLLAYALVKLDDGGKLDTGNATKGIDDLKEAKEMTQWTIDFI